MAKKLVTWEVRVFASQEVDDGGDPEFDFIEQSFPDGFPKICALCTGWAEDYILEVPEDPACWEFVDVSDVSERP